MWAYVFLGFLLGIIIGFVSGTFLATQREKKVRNELEEKHRKLSQEYEDLKQKCHNLELENERIQASLRTAEEKNQWLAQAKEALETTFKALASDVLRVNADQVLREAKETINALLNEVKSDWSRSKEEIRGLVEPLSKSLEKLDQQVRELESKREHAQGALVQQLRQMAETNNELGKITRQILDALKSPMARGRWGEMQLRRIVEFAGLQKHVDFEEQVGTDSGRPDLIVHLPNGGILAVDAKAPMDAFLKALEATDEETKRKYAEQHAQTLLGHMRTLGKKRYWESLGRSPDLVVMFVPSESCVVAAFEANPAILEEGWKNNVVVATPTLLFALLKTVAWGWQQHEIAEEARNIAEQAQELFKRFGTFAEHFRKIGDKLGQAVEAYNEAANSYRTRLRPLAQKLCEQLGKEISVPQDLARPSPLNE